ncbi:UDP-N-acetylglucosamine--N-acetylmuramyl-(pentapeptide) pyrophosphoryl-undecaprenol N-acetylglucosamine transferase [Actinomarinicola tropica]|uniref:UDP-N-acetylglucosamine--N-acetylmuramyl-(pentapeptide) pyrophosphoryl-undecaprenol N-acetylglucosamine transferase n=1 Tax=Actinomarinicola tropica TaxID=2789776 RepID=A0A5Q2RM96_9ACTN|nr:UDP-N-acetylglucosamine--N-acetylmuramyl-(pentapeptide) pyrophosphoryl-undecaprenol N-acetylglucosamine transferase [Actinomarinicola tropica]QGG95546.1 UDP-N-acetylglucosamine--N-acetylmuramyl-(pentapeptide) pyrophosphoryl-undecaprenol N-acetylglucosamine transferase [Actinomarinicola tropica]
MTDPVPPTEPRTWCLVAGGGTAGHVVPGLAVARALVDAGHPPESIHFLGSARGTETSMVPAAGHPLTVLPGRGLNDRRVNLENLRAAWGIVRGVVRGIGVVRRLRPSVVLSLGGYAAVPGVVGAAIWRVPVVVTEQNARASLANRLAGRVARACAVPAARTDLPRAVVTGNPVRPEIVEAAEVAADPVRRAALRAELGVGEDQVLVFVQSGSLGARSVNRAVIDLVGRLAERDDVHVRHVIGRRDWHTEHAPTPTTVDGGLVYDPVEYEDETPRWMAAADLFIGRSGASTVAELAVVGLASILVPLPIAPRDAQRANAELLVEVGAARIVADAELTGARLEAVVAELISDRAVLAATGRAALDAGHPDAARRVAALCEEHARG